MAKTGIIPTTAYTLYTVCSLVPGMDGYHPLPPKITSEILKAQCKKPQFEVKSILIISNYVFFSILVNVSFLNHKYSKLYIRQLKLITTQHNSGYFIMQRCH